jgi:hypothetical protein
MEQIQVTVSGQSRVELAKRLRAFADNLDGTPAGADGKVSGKAATTAAAEPTKAAGKKKAEVVEESFDLGEDTAPENEEKAITKADLIAACRDNRETAIKVLKKMKLNSVHDLKPAQYSKFLSELAG